MCEHCWETEYGKADVLSGTVLRAVALIDAIYKVQSSCGGSMHCILEDWNLDCFDEHPDDMELTPEERACYDFMAGLTIAERASALARYEEFIT
jgi:hypothetical protein